MQKANHGVKYLAEFLKNVYILGVGEWIKRRLWDGQKMVCMDDFEKAFMTTNNGDDDSPCIVYSFSLHADESLIKTFLKYGKI